MNPHHDDEDDKIGALFTGLFLATFAVILSLLFFLWLVT